MLVRRRLALGVLLHAADALDAELFPEVLHHRPRNVQRVVREKPADVAHGAHLEGEPEPVVVTASLRDQLAVLVVEEEEPLQLWLGRLLVELPVRSRLLVGQELHWHGPDANDASSRSTTFRERRHQADRLCWKPVITAVPLYRCAPRPGKRVDAGAGVPLQGADGCAVLVPLYRDSLRLGPSSSLPTLTANASSRNLTPRN